MSMKLFKHWRSFGLKNTNQVQIQVHVFTFTVVEVDALSLRGFGQRQGCFLCGQIQERVLHKQTNHAAVPCHTGLRPQAQRHDLHPHSIRRLRTNPRITVYTLTQFFRWTHIMTENLNLFQETETIHSDSHSSHSTVNIFGLWPVDRTKTEAVTLTSGFCSFKWLNWFTIIERCKSELFPLF